MLALALRLMAANPVRIKRIAFGISIATAALGGAIEVPAIDGEKAKVQVPAGTQGGHQFRLKGRGMRHLRSQSRGDMYVEVAVETPVNLTKRQRELLAAFHDAHCPRSLAVVDG